MKSLRHQPSLPRQLLHLSFWTLRLSLCLPAALHPTTHTTHTCLHPSLCLTQLSLDNEPSLLPQSPHRRDSWVPLAKAFGKLRINSRSMAANFKSYLSQRSSSQAEASEVEATGKTNGFSCVTSVPAAAPWRPIHKSVSSGASLSPFSQVAQDYSECVCVWWEGRG
ncbi:hypothetical protein E2C01_093690 [Portunus trituberculatus]|uniref:Uncharacterized protein n=1 Tax=Portunus trituberculatus TaxID=210409 RepID=A0A5B7K141_PORTR|nr:hypothetical protein [Portunus trituberculatus]